MVGGLCQLGGIIYHAALKSRLEIIERVNHSVDFYTDETRFTPIGTDAAVSYGYKDLKLKNNLDQSIRFVFQTTDQQFSLFLESNKELIPSELKFEIHFEQERKIVKCMDDSKSIVGVSKYLALRK